jgi:hypothetical protein
MIERALTAVARRKCLKSGLPVCENDVVTTFVINTDVKTNAPDVVLVLRRTFMWLDSF